MRNYIAPEYKNEEVVSEDIITVSPEANPNVTHNYGGVTGLTQTIEDVYSSEEGSEDQVTGQKAVFSYSISNFF